LFVVGRLWLLCVSLCCSSSLLYFGIPQSPYS
jgi:hypothetical protein